MKQKGRKRRKRRKKRSRDADVQRDLSFHGRGDLQSAGETWRTGWFSPAQLEVRLNERVGFTRTSLSPISRTG